LERDRFDNEDAVYLLMIDDDSGNLMGSHRILPTMKPHLFSDIFPEFCNLRGVQVGPRIYELTRSCVDEDSLSKPEIRLARKRLMAGLMEFCVKAGLERFTVLGRVEIISVYVRLGWNIKPLGVPKSFDGVQQVGAMVETTTEALASVRHAYRIDEDLVSYVGPRPEPGLIELHRIEQPIRHVAH
jgi:acyl-homoserine lactone synthase